VQDSKPSPGPDREELETADQAFFNQEGNATDHFKEIDANVHRVIENPLTESTGPHAKEEPLPEDLQWTQRTRNRGPEKKGV
jgi:hypothetical protein